MPAREVAVVSAPLPEFLRHPPPLEPMPPRPLVPSRPEEDHAPAYSPAGQRAYFQRGRLVHRLLQSLPDLPEAQREGACARYLARHATEMPESERVTLSREVLAVLRHRDFAAVFGPGSQAEVPITGMIEGEEVRIVSGQIDRLVVTEREVLIVDFKTNREPPESLANIPAAYLAQMWAYRAVLERIYPQHKVRCALLWTAGPVLMPVLEEVAGWHGGKVAVG